MSLSSSDVHLELLKNREYPLAFDASKPFAQQRAAIEMKFRKLLGMPEKQTEPKPIIDFIRRDDERFDEIRFKFAGTRHRYAHLAGTCDLPR